ncbi:cytochrome P450 71AU50-like [Salvia miltiorrhiza]|uniref:cytochrome P450 71AU50-like n=1 Tax=Salvia miltiorrhiza TaxID=226208 RepID=UPI0025AC7353|nr:cytochrome P450 71AU50-like [Salvia miltiorrhiza]
MAWLWSLAVLLLVALFYEWRNQKKKKSRRLPPGPRGLPIIGHIHLLGKNPHQDFRRLAEEHGEIMHMRLGSLPIVVVSSPATAELVLKTHDAVLSDRPHYLSTTRLTYGHRDVIFAPCGPYWRNMRKLCTLELLSGLRIDEFQPMRRAEIMRAVDGLRRAAEEGEVVDVSARVSGLVGDMNCLMVFGRKFVDRDLDQELGFKDVIEETTRVAAQPNLGDYFPLVAPLDLQGLNRRVERLSATFDGFLDMIIDDHVKKNEEEKEKKDKDFVDVMMGIMESGAAGFDFDRRHVKAMLLDMLIGGIDTTSTAVDWIMSELMKNPTVMKKLQKEIEEVVGMDQMVEKSHLCSLKYLDCVVKESLRLHPVAPLLAHAAQGDCQVAGFDIPDKTHVFVNVWAIGRDPHVWPNPETFCPDRFLRSNVDFRGRDFQLLPFGSGRRSCPGLQLGLTIVRSVVAQLVHCFDWELPDGMLADELDMFEKYGMVITRAKHLRAIPTYRLSR